MKPTNLKTKLFLDSGDPEETKKIIEILGFLDGQTTNPSLITKNPTAVERIKTGNKFAKEEVYEFYRKVVTDVSHLIPAGSVSVEVYADFNTKSSEMLLQAKEMNSWIPNAHIKLPIIKEGLEAANLAVKEGLRVNMTLCFTQEQAAGVDLATKGASKGQVFISPFIGRLDDIQKDGISLIQNILKYYKNVGSNVEVLAASVRNLKHFMACLALECDIITAPFAVLKEWANNGKIVPDKSYVYNSGFEKISYVENLQIQNNWQGISIENELTTKGIEKFCSDWNNLIA